MDEGASGSPVEELTGEAKVDIAQLSSALGVLRTALWLLLLAGVGVLLLGIGFGDPNSIAAGGALVAASPFLFLALRRDPKLAITGGVSVVLGIGGYVTTHGGGIHDVGMVAFPAVMIFSAMLLEGRRFVLFSTLAVTAVATVGVAELSGALTTKFSSYVTPVDLAVLVLVLATMAWLMHAITQTLYRSLGEAYVNEQTYREIFNATSDGILVLDATTGHIVDANNAATNMLERDHEAVLKLSLGELLEPPVGARVPQLLRRTCEQGPQTVECLVESHGRGRWLEVSLRAATIGGEPRVAAALRDIDERKAVERRALESERLQAIGQLAGGVAHDFNNQLTAILANATLLKGSLSHNSRAMAQLDAIVQSSNRSADLTRQLLAFARKGQTRRQSVDIDALIEEVISLLARSIDKRIELKHEANAGGRAWVQGDPGLLQNALLNLGLNARDAMPVGGQLVFTTTLADAEAPDPTPGSHAEGNTRVVVAVADSGVGMAQEVAARVFEPFFTTKEAGNGMGLAAVWGTIRAHSGSIAVHSEPGRGTRFELSLPATQEPPAREPASTESTPPPQLRVLLAEDEELVARATIDALQSLGCKVTHRGDGRSALQAFEGDPDGFDVVMLDHAMPHMTGGDLAVELRRIRARLPIIMTSGLQESWRGQGDPATLLPKPFDLDELREALQKASSRLLP